MKAIAPVNVSMAAISAQAVAKSRVSIVVRMMAEGTVSVRNGIAMHAPRTTS